MKNTANKKGFTLVELIIVVTILAILATIAFISFQGYTAQSRDAKVQSELGNVRNVIEVETAKGVGLLNFVSNTGSQLANLSLGGTGVSVSDVNVYKAGRINESLLGQEFENPYVMGASTKAGGVYQLAGKLTADGDSAYVIGTYNPRTSSDTASGSTDSNKVLTLTSGMGLFKVGDYIGDGTNTGQVLSVSSDLTRLTLDVTTVTGSGIKIAVNEEDGLIESITTTDTPVTDGGSNLPY